MKGNKIFLYFFFFLSAVLGYLIGVVSYSVYMVMILILVS